MEEYKNLDISTQAELIRQIVFLLPICLLPIPLSTHKFNFVQLLIKAE